MIDLFFNPDFFTLKYNVDLSEKYWEQLSLSDQNVTALLTPDLVLYGSIKISNTNYRLVIGPSPFYHNR